MYQIKCIFPDPHIYMLILLEVDSIAVKGCSAVPYSVRYQMFILVWVHQKPLGLVCIVFAGLSVYCKS